MELTYDTYGRVEHKRVYQTGGAEDTCRRVDYV